MIGFAKCRDFNVGRWGLEELNHVLFIFRKKHIGLLALSKVSVGLIYEAFYRVDSTKRQVPFRPRMSGLGEMLRRKVIGEAFTDKVQNKKVSLILVKLECIIYYLTEINN